MDSNQNSISEEEIKKRFTELSGELGDKLKYDVDQLCEIYQDLKKNGYLISGFIGNGAEGPVFSAFNNGKQIAVKVISANDASKIDKELEIMDKFRNKPYIHQIIKAFYSENKKHFFYLTEKLTCDLEQIMLILNNKKQKFTYNQIITFTVQMATALSLLENEKVIHSDLKPANILYDQIQKCFKISDYGFAKTIKQKSQMMSATKNINGYTIKYVAPEIWKSTQDYTCKIDIFSLGIILLELIQGRELDMFEVMTIQTGAVKASNYLKNDDKQYNLLNKIISSMLDVDRKNRVSAKDLLSELKSLQSNEESNLCSYLDDYLLTKSDNATLESMKQLYLSSLRQLNLDYTIDNSRRIFMKHHSIKFGNISSLEEFTEVEEALAKYQMDSSVSLDVKLPFFNYHDIYDDDDNNQFKKQLLEMQMRLSVSLEKCSWSITVLHLVFYDIKIGSVGAQSLAKAIQKCSNNLLDVSLILFGSSVGRDEIKYIQKGLEMCEKLTKLNVITNGNNNEQSIQEFGSSLAKWPHLITMCLDSQLSYAITSRLSLFAKLTNLTLHLDFDDDEEYIQSLQTSLKQCSNLTSLCLIMDGYTLDDMIALTESVENSNLVELKFMFSRFKLDDEEKSKVSSLGESLSKFKSLKSLCLLWEDTYYNPTQFISTLLTQHLVKCQNITSFSLGLQSGNENSELDYSDAEIIGQSLENCNYLKTLNLYLWDIWSSIKCVICISQSLQKCAHLTALELNVLERWEGSYFDRFYQRYCFKIDGVSSEINDNLKKCKNFEYLDVDLNGEHKDQNFYQKLGIMTSYQAEIWSGFIPKSNFYD